MKIAANSSLTNPQTKSIYILRPCKDARHHTGTCLASRQHIVLPTIKWRGANHTKRHWHWSTTHRNDLQFRCQSPDQCPRRCFFLNFFGHSWLIPHCLPWCPHRRSCVSYPTATFRRVTSSRSQLRPSGKNEESCCLNRKTNCLKNAISFLPPDNLLRASNLLLEYNKVSLMMRNWKNYVV